MKLDLNGRCVVASVLHLTSDVSGHFSENILYCMHKYKAIVGIKKVISKLQVRINTAYFMFFFIKNGQSRFRL